MGGDEEIERGTGEDQAKTILADDSSKKKKDNEEPEMVRIPAC